MEKLFKKRSSNLNKAENFLNLFNFFDQAFSKKIQVLIFIHCKLLHFYQNYFFEKRIQKLNPAKKAINIKI